jgi:hypothetical protein
VGEKIAMLMQGAPLHRHAIPPATTARTMRMSTLLMPIALLAILVHAVSLELIRGIMTYLGDDNHGIKVHDVFIVRPALD